MKINGLMILFCLVYFSIHISYSPKEKTISKAEKIRKKLKQQITKQNQQTKPT
jgi:hypothetical protein